MVEERFFRSTREPLEERFFSLEQCGKLKKVDGGDGSHGSDGFAGVVKAVKMFVV